MSMNDLVQVLERLGDDLDGGEEDQGLDEGECLVVEEAGAGECRDACHDVLAVGLEVGVAGGLECGVEGFADVLVAFGDQLENEVDQGAGEGGVFGDEFEELLALDDDFWVVVGFVDQLEHFVRVDEHEQLLQTEH